MENPGKNKTSKLALVSLVCSISGFFLIGMTLFLIFSPHNNFLFDITKTFLQKIVEKNNGLLWIAILATLIIATFLSGELAWRYVKKRDNELVNKRLIRFSINLGAINTFIFLFVLLIVWIGTPEPPRRDAHFKATCHSFVPAAVICCDEKGEITANIGQEFCKPNTINANWPTENEISSIKIIKNCQEDGTFEFLVSPPKRLSDSSGRCISATCTETGCIFKGCY